MDAAAALDPLPLYHWVLYPVAPQPAENRTLYWPGSRSVRLYPVTEVTATTGSGTLAVSGNAVTQTPGSALADGPDTVPVISPSGCSAASIDGVVAPTVTGTNCAVPCVPDPVVVPLYHCGARPGGGIRHSGSLKYTV